MSKLALATRLGAAAAAALLLAGCTAAGGGAASSASPSADPTVSIVAQPDPNHPDPCELLTAADFEEWGGTPEMTDGRFIGSLSGDGRSICRWQPASDELSVPRIQVLLNWEYADIAEQRELSEGIGAKTEDIEIEGASSAYAAYGGRTIAMEVGDYFVQVSYTRPTSKAADVKRACAHFATLVASRLA
ncbi:DUF3558 family protein [Demequina sp. SYSU T00039]|uniref:DUF3558 family protein n=1 Tax=Demequina lignilytica TaxID=3051663 RepID=A0AAW7M608_9MICO|nr:MULTISPECIES: DUF3558 family protein [unclassified Demequina]MDN4479258.1 DUF3558 family protein [Demequina sp. SYSU T00039-1]MDN4487576.1 DUF3558 family protein [Demequina sp. SYSU T00039]